MKRIRHPRHAEMEKTFKRGIKNNVDSSEALREKKTNKQKKDCDKGPNCSRKDRKNPL